MTVVSNFLRHLGVEYGGISASVPAFCVAAKENTFFREEIVAFSETSECCDQSVRVRHFQPSAAAWVGTGQTSAFIQYARKIDIFHLHGLWQEHFLLGSALGGLSSKPVIVSPHGMLDGWALSQKQLKKRLFTLLIQRPLLNRASCIRALTIAEAADIRKYGINVPIAVVPNGVTAPVRYNTEEIFDLHPVLRGKPLAVYLGRIHKKKGIDLLCDAWKTVAERQSDAHLVIAGPTDGEASERLVSFIGRGGLKERITLTGTLRGDAKWSLLANSTVFVLPSYSEGLSVAVLESLAVGTPVVISRPCNLPEVERNACGWVIELDSGCLANALIGAFEMRSPETASMRCRAAEFAAAHYSWNHVVQKMQEIYDWVLKGRLPRTVEVL